MKHSALMILAVMPLAACATVDLPLPDTMGERNSGYNYIPLDPLPVRAGAYTKCRSRRENKPPDVMDALPDNAVRIAIQDVSAGADATLGPVVIGGGGSHYRVTLDYIAADTANIRFRLSSDAGNPIKLLGNPNSAGLVTVDRIDDAPASEARGQTAEVVIPVYVGVGLRLTALVEVRRGKLNLASLGALAAAAEARRAAGTLVVQTLGVNGEQVAASLPLPSELNQTTVQNAILSLGSVKAILYDGDTSVSARVTGIYNPLPSSDPRLINAIVSELARTPIPWTPCGSGPAGQGETTGP